MGVLATDWPDNPWQDERQLCLYYRTPISGTCISSSAAPRWEFASLAHARSFSSCFSPRVFRRARVHDVAGTAERVDAGFPRFGTNAWEKGRRTERGYPRGITSSIHEGARSSQRAPVGLITMPYKI